jgi:hypothetical protein
MKPQILTSKEPVSGSYRGRSLRRVALALLFTLFAGPSLFAQQRYHYRFELQGITDGPGAKVVTDFLRPVFNNTESPYAVFPDFNDELDIFDFFSDIPVTREQLEIALAPHNIMVTSFSNTDTVEPQAEQR